ncbi:A24 family peptidase [Nocardia huaxiensis]|uniref:Prepilin peptidase n=1 Tax=Nocardia huaxiensis TaxID=2755382 RepID=A0A7D6ZJA3_9NOCA|nr:A24 family peptidase [Nocardia huaxiensis]QLY29083.1 prepilin peptidase [Nocardia huaxiensis]UFS97431.1 A24 family peptidase [Nocardia huaxiensis]
MEIIALLAFTVWCMALSGIDVRDRRLPNALTLPGAAAILGYGFLGGRWSTAVLGALLLAVPYLLVHLLAPDALGAGDVKLALGLGAATALGGAQTWVWAAMAAPALTACAGVALRVLNRQHRASGTSLPSVALVTSADPDRRSGTRPPPRSPSSIRAVRPWDSPLSRLPETAVPHGPAMCAASLVALVVGP